MQLLRPGLNIYDSNCKPICLKNLFFFLVKKELIKTISFNLKKFFLKRSLKITFFLLLTGKEMAVHVHIQTDM